MRLMVCVLMCCAVASAQEPKKPEKPLTPKQIREAEEKAIKDKMAPLEKKLAENKEDMAAAKAAPVGGPNAVKPLKGGRNKHLGFKTAERKKEIIETYEAEIKKLNEQLQPLEDELKALKKKPLPKPDDKPKPPEKPEAKP